VTSELLITFLGELLVPDYEINALVLSFEVFSPEIRQNLNSAARLISVAKKNKFRVLAQNSANSWKPWCL